MLELKLFGTGQVRYFERSLAGFPNQQCCLLLCYLLLNRHRSHCRERLAAVFWGECPTDVSRKHLSQALWRLRQALGSIGAPADDYLSVSKDSVSFVSSSPHWLDIEHFERVLARYQDLSGQELSPEQAAHLEEAVDLHTGDLLEGIYEDWCLAERECLSLLYLNALSKLMLFHESNGDYERGLACGERILAHDNTREKTHQHMMRLHWLLGDRGTAIAQYKRCAQILHDELGISPAQETGLLYQQMMRNQFKPPHRPDAQTISAPTTGVSDESFQLLAQHALQKLSRLQAALEKTTNELHHVERLINGALLDSRQS
jgi:DNA-binding SARP family transcriptional activator